jgi:hypothetical protein
VLLLMPSFGNHYLFYLECWSELKNYLLPTNLAGFGAGSGLVLHTGAQWARRFGLFPAKLNRNTAMLAVLGGGALGMFIFAARTGKEQVHNLHPIFQVGALPEGDLDYQRALIKARERDEDVGEFDKDSPNRSDKLDLNKLQKMRVVRRRSLMDSIEKGHGLSDSHGGHWYPENEKK